jgi:DNA-binding MarR family transcriptional regulator
MKKDLNKLIVNIGDIFFQFQAKLQFFEREYLRKLGIDDVTPNEVKVLYIIGISNTKSMSEIADALKVTRGTLSITVDSLVKKGYVIRTRNKQDRRVIILYLTEKAIGIIKQYGKFFENLLLTLANDIEKEKLFVFEEIFEKLNLIIESDFYNVDEDIIKKIHESENNNNLDFEENI